MSEPEPRPSWMPSDESLAALAHNTALYLTCEKSDALDELKDLLLATGLRAQVEALESWYDSDADDEIGAELTHLRRRLKELEADREM